MSVHKALLITDIVDSTELARQLGDEAMSELWREHDRVCVAGGAARSTAATACSCSSTMPVMVWAMRWTDRKRIAFEHLALPNAALLLFRRQRESAVVQPGACFQQP